MIDKKTTTKLELIVALNEALRDETYANPKRLYKSLPPDFERDLLDLVKKIKANEITEDNIGSDKYKHYMETIEKYFLTHYLAYICNRQTLTDRVFNEGGYTISCMVISFFEERVTPTFPSFDDWFISRFICDKKQFCLKAQKDGAQITFASRFMPQEASSMYRFLRYLYESGNDFFDIFRNNDFDLTKIAECLDANTYYVEGVTKPKDVIPFFTNENSSDTKFGKKKENHCFEKRKFSSKRLWCCLRDYLHGYHFSLLLRVVIGQEAFKKLIEKDYLIELPGDLYNNDKNFARCVWGSNFPELKEAEKRDGEETKEKGFHSSKFVRERYEEQKKIVPKLCWKPIDYDISFQYVQNMCRHGRCNQCPMAGDSHWKDFYKKNSELYTEHLKHLCHKKKDAYCVYMLTVLDMLHICPGESACNILHGTENLEHWKKLHNKRLQDLCHKTKGTYCPFVSTALGFYYKCPGEEGCKKKGNFVNVINKLTEE